MDYICLHDKKEIERFLAKNVYLHIYSMGDLDEFFWPHTIWYGSRSYGSLKAVILLYVGMSIPTVLALSDEHKAMAKLLISIRHLLPSRFYAHLSPCIEDVFNKTHDSTGHGPHFKMALMQKTNAFQISCPDVKALSIKDLDAIQALYRESYPGNWFDLRMLETQKYFGIWEKSKLVSIAGIHVYSKRYKVAALGNITTLPTHRKKGYSCQVTAKLCQSLIDEGIQIGLNVQSDNQAAISCYKKIGFEIVAPYSEYIFQNKGKDLNSL